MSSIASLWCNLHVGMLNPWTAEMLTRAKAAVNNQRIFSKRVTWSNRHTVVRFTDCLHKQKRLLHVSERREVYQKGRKTNSCSKPSSNWRSKLKFWPNVGFVPKCWGDAWREDLHQDQHANCNTKRRCSYRKKREWKKNWHRRRGKRRRSRMNPLFYDCWGVIKTVYFSLSV